METKVIHIIACGQSGQHYKGQTPSIGVNDCKKWGYDPEVLLLLNLPSQFPLERLRKIKSTETDFIYADSTSQWERIFEHTSILPFESRQWSHANRLQKISKNYYYHSKTSPFAAISLAFSMGFKEIVLWGVDFIDHRVYSPGKDMFINEYNNYKSFCMSLKEAGVNVYLGSEGSNLNFLPVWQK